MNLELHCIKQKTPRMWGYSSSLESELVLFCLFFVWDNAAPKAMPILMPMPILSVAAPIPMPIATPAKNFNSPLISKSTNNYNIK